MFGLSSKQHLDENQAPFSHHDASDATQAQDQGQYHQNVTVVDRADGSGEDGPGADEGIPTEEGQAKQIE